MRKVLNEKFFTRPVLNIAPELLGKFLVIKTGDGEVALEINEVEAYDGPEDRANHAHKGRTARTETMFIRGGIWYVYLVYGMHNMLNIVTGPEDYPAAVLIRGAGDYDGPGKLTKALSIDRSYNREKAESQSGLWIEDRGVQVPNSCIKRMPRVGVGYAGDDWAERHYRFVLDRF